MRRGAARKGAMTYVALLLVLVTAWTLTHLAAAGLKALDATRRDAAPSGVSILPGVVAFPLLFLLIAYLLDRIHLFLGTLVVGVGHIALAVIASASFIVSIYKARQHRLGRGPRRGGSNGAE